MSSLSNLGAVFPDLAVETQLGPLRIYEYQGADWLILFSHPNDFTPVCTTELGEAAARAPAFAARGVRLMALSCDSVADHVAWCADIAAARGAAVTFPIIADASRAIAAQLGMLDEEERCAAGLPATVRKVFFVAPDRRVRLVLVYPTAVGRSFAEILRCVDALQLTAKHPVATPAEWAPGGPVMIQPTVSNADAAARFPRHARVALPSGRGYLRSTSCPR